MAGPYLPTWPFPGICICGTYHEAAMLWTVSVILLVLWLLGIVSAYTFGGFIHVLLALAVAVMLMRVMQSQQSLD
jgi:hypothetical protein